MHTYYAALMVLFLQEEDEIRYMETFCYHNVLYSTALDAYGKAARTNKIPQCGLLSIWITMHLLNTSKYLIYILIHTCPFLQMEKWLSRILIDGANVKYTLKTAWD